MDDQDRIKRLSGSEPADEGNKRSTLPTTQTSMLSHAADVSETASGEQPSEQVSLTRQILLPTATPSSTRGAEADARTAWQVGDLILGQYEVKGRLGEGGMGTVYKVHHRGWNTDLAVKSPKPEIFAKAGGKENFIREAETWVKLGLHPHIVSCYYVRTMGGIPRVFAEYVASGSLADWIRTRRLYEGKHEEALERILDVAIQFAWGLHYAHEQGLVHQDVKPANVMMTADGIAKVTDFGLAKARAMVGKVGMQGERQSILVSSRGMTPAYCSPEQAANGPLSRKTDIWSWGVSVLEMFVGGVTWMSGIVAREALVSHKTQDPAIPLMPVEVVKLLSQCFQQRPEERLATMQEVATELQAIYANLVGQPYPHQAPKTAEVRADSLNNKALSLFDLGKVEEAKQVWEQALKTDPRHLETTYNRGIVLWRQGALTDDVLVQLLEDVRATHGDQWRATYLLALVHLERGDGETVLALLREATQQLPEKTEMHMLLEQVQSGAIPLGRCLRTFTGHTNTVHSVRLSADNRWALWGSKGRVKHTLQLWEIATGRCLRTFTGHEDAVLSVDLSADGRFALSGSSDNTVRLWEVATGRCLRAFTGHTDEVSSVSLSADGRFALSGSRKLNRIKEGEDNTIRLWEVATGHCLRIFTDHTGPVSSVCQSANGSFALSGSMDETVRLWKLDWELEARELTDWDESVRSHMELFLTQHMPRAGVLPEDSEPTKKEIQQALTLCGRPTWNEQDFQDLIRQLQYMGYGWLRPEGVRRKLEEMTASWQGPPLSTDSQQLRKPSLWSRLFRFR